MVNVLEWLEERVREIPDEDAFVDEGSAMTYAQLEARSRAVGTFVANHSPARTPVACYMEKSTRAVAAMLGAVYAGCCYSFVDVRQPQTRARAIIDKLDPAVIIADESTITLATSAFTGYQVVLLEDIIGFETDSELLAYRRENAIDTDPLYINFTSGSTGTPKGVAVSHRSVIDFIGHFVSLFGIVQDDVIANQAPFDFDVSVKDIYGGLATGATVQMIPREFFSIPVNLMDFLAERKVTICTWAVSAMCFVSMMGGFDYRVPDTIRLVIFSGEVMPPKQLAVWRSALPNAMFVNAYGPTEVTCNCTYHIIVRDYAGDEVIPMGRPFPNERVFLLDEQDRLVEAPNVEGEVCVTGTCLALGYYNDPERTAASFVPNPLATETPERMYRTGDIAIIDEVGRFVYRGRKDHQVKHLGQRIELGEIDAVAQGLDGVERACTIYDQSRKRILMFYVGTCEKDALVAILREKLPQYMVPNRIRKLDVLPLTKNGKIDRQALASAR